MGVFRKRTKKRKDNNKDGLTTDEAVDEFVDFTKKWKETLDKEMETAKEMEKTFKKMNKTFKELAKALK